MNQTHAREWYWESSVGLTTEYDDNIQLDPDNVTGEISDTGSSDPNTDSSSEPLGSVTGLIPEATLTVGSATARDSFALDVGGDLSRYSEDELDSDNLFANFASSYLTERSTFEFLLSFDRDSTLNTEFEETGLLQEASRREKLSITPSLAHQINESNTIDIGYTHEDVSFANEDENGPFDFEEDSIFAIYTHILNRRTNVFVDSAITQFESLDNNDSKSDDFEISVGIFRQFSEPLSGRFSVGAQNSDNEATIDDERISDSNDGLIFDTGLDWTLPLLTISAGLSRNLASTGLGQRSERTKSTFDISRELSEKIQLFLKTSLNDDAFVSSDEDENETPDRRFYSIEPGVTWQVTTNWDIKSSYTYRKQKFDSIELEQGDNQQDVSRLSGRSAESNAIEVTLRYRWPRKLF